MAFWVSAQSSGARLRCPFLESRPIGGDGPDQIAGVALLSRHGRERSSDAVLGFGPIKRYAIACPFDQSRFIGGHRSGQIVSVVFAFAERLVQRLPRLFWVAAHSSGTRLRVLSLSAAS